MAIEDLLSTRPMSVDAIREAGRALISPASLPIIESAATVNALAFQLCQRNAAAAFRVGILDAIWREATTAYGEFRSQIPARLGLAGGQAGSAASKGWKMLLGDELYGALGEWFGTLARLAKHRTLLVAPSGSCVVSLNTWKQLGWLNERIVANPGLAREMAQAFTAAKRSTNLRALTNVDQMYCVVKEV